MLVLVCGGGIFVNKKNQVAVNDRKNVTPIAVKSVQNSSVTKNQIQAIEPEVTGKDLTSVKNSIQKAVNKRSELVIGVSLVDIDSGESTNVGGDRTFTAASTTKTLVATEFLHEVENGKYSLDMNLGNNSARYHLDQMIRLSNNDSWDIFNNLLTLRGEQTYASSLGINYNPYANSVSPNDLAMFLSRLYRNELISKENTDLILSSMRETHNMTLIPGSDISAKTYNKTGRLNGLIHDTAILDDGKSAYALVIFTDGKTTMENRVDLFHKITEAIFPG